MTDSSPNTFTNTFKTILLSGIDACTKGSFTRRSQDTIVDRRHMRNGVRRGDKGAYNRVEGIQRISRGEKARREEEKAAGPLSYFRVDSNARDISSNRITPPAPPFIIILLVFPLLHPHWMTFSRRPPCYEQKKIKKKRTKRKEKPKITKKEKTKPSLYCEEFFVFLYLSQFLSHHSHPCDSLVFSRFIYTLSRWSKCNPDNVLHLSSSHYSQVSFERPSSSRIFTLTFIIFFFLLFHTIICSYNLYPLQYIKYEVE